MGHIEIGVLPPEADAQRQVAADFLTQSMKSLREPAGVRSAFDTGRWAQEMVRGAAPFPREELTHNPTELVDVASAAFEKAATLARLAELQHYKDAES